MTTMNISKGDRVEIGTRVRVVTPTMMHSTSVAAPKNGVGVVTGTDFGAYIVKGNGWRGEAQEVEVLGDMGEDVKALVAAIRALGPQAQALAVAALQAE